MALEHADNFNIYGTNAALLTNGVYAAAVSVSLTTDPDGISSSRCLRLNGASHVVGGSHIRYILSSNQTRVGIAQRIWLDSLPSGGDGSTQIMQWRNASNAVIFSVSVETTGRLAANRPSGISETTAVPVVTAQGWYHCEGLLDLTANTFELRIEGLPVLTMTDLGFSSSDRVSQLAIVGTQSAVGSYHGLRIKDYVVYNGAGTHNTSFLGSVLVHNLTLTADVALNWTPSVGATGYEILDNNPPNDAQYISAVDSPLPAPYKGVLSDLPPEVTSVKGVITYVRAAKSDGGDGFLQSGLVVDPNGTPATSQGTNRPITVAQTYWRDVHETDPRNGNPLLPTTVNDLQLTINRTA